MTLQASASPFPKGILLAAAAATAFAILAVSGYLIHRGNAEAKAAEAQNAEKAAALLAATPGDLKPDGPLRNQLRQMSDFNDTNPEATGRALNGTVVEWTLTVFEVTPEGAAYRIQTSDRDKVETLLTVIPSEPDSRSRIKSLRMGDPITVRGVIRGVNMTRVEINPAILIH